MQVAREAAEEVKDAVVAAGASVSAGDGGLDMFADNVDADIFTGTPLVPQAAAPAKKALLDNYDDAEGYYNFQARCPSTASDHALRLLAAVFTVCHCMSDLRFLFCRSCD